MDFTTDSFVGVTEIALLETAEEGNEVVESVSLIEMCGSSFKRGLFTMNLSICKITSVMIVKQSKK